LKRVLPGYDGEMLRLARAYRSHLSREFEPVILFGGDKGTGLGVVGLLRDGGRTPRQAIAHLFTIEARNRMPASAPLIWA